jgi:S-DNA-T family DNA segregation ATPase FtsK/SpoIIIE
MAFSIITVISLVSHNPADPSLNHALSGKVAVKNFAGLGGAYLSDILIQLFGGVAFVLPVITLALGILLFKNETLSFASWLVSGGLIFMLAVCPLLFIFSPSDPSYPEVPGGGLFGMILAEKLLVRFLAKPGAVVVSFMLLFISFLVTTRLSTGQFLDLVREWAEKIMTVVSSGFEGAKKLWAKTKKASKKLLSKKEPEIVSRPQTDAGQPEIVKKPKEKKGVADDFAVEQSRFTFMKDAHDYTLPPMSYLQDPKQASSEKSDRELLVNSQILTRKLEDFSIEGQVTKVLPGPVITLYEFEPAAGVKVSRIVGLADDLAMGLRAVSVRILAPVPGKAVVGIEVPNTQLEGVALKQVLASEEFADSRSKLTLALGADTSGVPVATDLAAIPHLLIAGATGSGKSVGLNSMIMSILYKATPAEVNFIMIDPKMLELSIYDGIPHLIAPVVTNPKKASNALRWAVSEMERRYRLLADKGFRNIGGYNLWAREQREQQERDKAARKKKEPVTKRFDAGGVIEEEEEELKHLPYIVIVIDELADLMMVASKDVEDALARLAQMARASGIHLIVATQRPSVDVLTGLIKANFPARISYQVSSRIDSRTILDTIGAEKLLGKGDLLFLPPGTSRLQRIHGPFVADEEIKRVVEFLRKQGRPVYKEEILMAQAKADETLPGGEDDDDEYFEQAVELVAQTRQASISMIQRRLRIGYNRAARIVEMMEAKGMVGPVDGAKPRQVFIPPSGADRFT